MEMNEVMNRANCGHNIESALCASSKGTYCSSKRDGLAFYLQRGVDSEHANEKFHLDSPRNYSCLDRVLQSTLQR